MDRRILQAWRIWQSLLNRKFTSHFTLNARILSRTVRSMFRDSDYDCIVLGAGEPELIAYLQTSLPIIYIADTTFANMVDYYPWHTGLSKNAINQGNAIEQKALDRSYHIIYSSEWAATSARKVYNVSPGKISVASFGDSLNAVPSFTELSYRKLTDTCKLLFIGSNWERKGGPLAMEIYNQMQQQGLKCLLSIVGCNPQIQPQKGIRIYPFLDKANAIDNELLQQLYMESDFLLLPTRADCTPVVFSEAAAFGLPVITTDTGGIKSVIHHGENGFYLPMEAGAEMYVDLIRKIMNDKPQRISLQRKSREAYESRLNWNHWLEAFNLITRSLRIN